MKVAIAGKGGVGKTSISGTLARQLARSGHRVLAIDADSNPNLALTLGISEAQLKEVPTLSSDLLVRAAGEGDRLARSFDEICATHTVQGPDGVRLLVMAHPRRAGTG
jgi:CO dehydrogenase maturation factor